MTRRYHENGVGSRLEPLTRTLIETEGRSRLLDIRKTPDLGEPDLYAPCAFHAPEELFRKEEEAHEIPAEVSRVLRYAWHRGPKARMRAVLGMKCNKQSKAPAKTVPSETFGYT